MFDGARFLFFFGYLLHSRCRLFCLGLNNKKIRGKKKNGNLRRLFNEICLIHLVNRKKNEEIFFLVHNGLKWKEMRWPVDMLLIFFCFNGIWTNFVDF
jgi:hypothetical protein